MSKDQNSQPRSTQEQISALIDAMDQLLDDLGRHSECVSRFAKAKARVAMQPFITSDHASDNYMPLWQAERILKEHDA